MEVDGHGNVFVASAQQYNDNDWVLIYNESSPQPGHETARVKLNDLFEGQQFPVPEGPGALRVSSTFEDTLYLASLVNASAGLRTRVYRFAIQWVGDMATGLAFSGAVEIENPTPTICDGQIACDDYVSSVTSIAEAPDGTLYVVGLTAPKFPAEDPLSVSELFTTPTLAVVPADVMWSVSTNGVETIAATRITGCDLGLPLSAVLVGGGAEVPGDLDGDGDVDLDDYEIFVGCLTGPRAVVAADGDEDGDVDQDDFATWAPCLAGPGVTVSEGCRAKDLDGDGDVDLSDFLGFQASFTGSDGVLPPECQSADLDSDQDVDVSDFGVFQEAFSP